MKKVLLLIILAASLYLPSLGVFFSGDDFFHLRISQIDSWQEFLSFFSFDKNPHSASFYRPLTTQVFFWAGRSLFGLNPFGSHLVTLIIYGLILYLVYLLAKKLFREEKIALLALFFYAFSSSHFTQVFYLSVFQELGMAVFYFAGLLFWVKFLEEKKPKHLLLTIILFILSLASKETAATFPLLAGLIAIYQKKQKYLFSLMPLLLIELVYSYLRFARFGPVAGESYLWEVSPKVFNTLAWYGVWSLGIPEMFLDFIGPKLTVSSKLFLYYPWQTKTIFVSFSIFLLVCFFSFLQKIRTNLKLFTFYFLLFTFSLLPVLFLPWHKFPLELTIPLFGAALFLGILFSQAKRLFLILGLTSFLVLNLASYILTYKTHWVVRRGEVAKRVLGYFTREYPKFPQQKAVYFYNDSAFITEGWGASKHLATALSGSDALQVLYHDPEIKVYYQDFDGEKTGENLIRLGTKEFLGY